MRGVPGACFSESRLDRSTRRVIIALGRGGGDHVKAQDGVCVLMGGTRTRACSVDAMANWFQLRSLRITGTVRGGKKNKNGADAVVAVHFLMLKILFWF